MTDNIGYGKEKRREGNLKVLAGEATFRYVMPPIRDNVLTTNASAGMLSARCWIAW